MTRSVLLVAHTGRKSAVAAARDLAARLLLAHTRVLALDNEQASLRCDGVEAVSAEAAAEDHGLDLVVALGGDGTLLRAAEIARPAGSPLLGINLGHVGFLAEGERSDLDVTAERILHKT